MKQNFIKKLPKDSHKYSHGTVAVFAGSSKYAGAALLCVGGARRGGAGYINFINKDSLIRNLILSAYPDVVARKKIIDIKVDAWVIGPGSPNVGRRLSIHRAKYAVLDSDATKFTKKINAEFVVITPHEGEARHMGFVIGEGDRARKESALEMARALNCVVVLKGYHTVVSSPEGLAVMDTLAGPELATAGTGDILAGLIGSMLASWKPESFSDVVAVVFKAISAHALAAKVASQEINPITSSDILRYLPIILNNS